MASPHTCIFVYMYVCVVSVFGILPPKLCTLLFETGFLMETWKISYLARMAIHQFPEIPLPLPLMHWLLHALLPLQLHCFPCSLFPWICSERKPFQSTVKRTLPTAMEIVVLINIPRSGTVKCAFSPFFVEYCPILLNVLAVTIKQ